MIIILVLASLSLGFPDDIGEHRETFHGSTTVGQTIQKSANAPCSLSVTSGGPYITVDSALQQICNDGYEITLGTVSGQTQTIWQAQTGFRPETLIKQKRGTLSIVNIDFRFVIVGVSAQPWNIIISVQPDLDIDENPVDFPTLVVNNCNFQGFGKASTFVNQMINVVNASQVFIHSCTFRSTHSIQVLIQASEYRTFTVDQTNFTDINGDIVDAIELSDGRENIQHVIEITGNRFDRCATSIVGTVAIWTSKSTEDDTLKINNNHFINCTGQMTGGINLNYKEYGTIQFYQNVFQSNVMDGQDDNYGGDASIQKMTALKEQDVVLKDQDIVQYYKNTFAGSTTDNPYSVFQYVQYGQDSGYFNLRSASGQCWDPQFESGGNYDGCACTEQSHPNFCACPTNVPISTQEKCYFVKLPPCTGVSQPTGECKCSPSVYPSYCQCPLNNDDFSYTKYQCEREKKYALLPQCTINTTTPQGGCKCTADQHPIQPTPCACPLNNVGDYTKLQCEIDTQQEPTDPFDCERDLQADTPTYRCACPDKEDKAKWDSDPRTKKGFVCADASESVKVVIGVVLAVIVIPILIVQI